MKTFLLPLLLSTAFSLSADSFYIWQRNWNSDVIGAVTREKRSDAFYYLAGELRLKNGKVRFERISPDRKSLNRLPNIPVFRIHTSMLKLTDGELASLLYDPGLTAMQLDLDCPESKLERYTGIVRALKKRYGGKISVSATVLPVHLKHEEFRSLIAELDFYVLQVHGLEFQKGASLIRESVALPAIRKALSLGKPFMAALPCYAYQLNYRDGKFLSLNAEIIPKLEQGVERVLLEADYGVVRKCLELLRENGKKAIWFRLPVEGDFFCLDRFSVQRLMDGKIPEKSLKSHWKKEKNGLMVLTVKNIALLGEKEIRVKLNLSSFSIADYGFMNGFKPENELVFGLVPDSAGGLAPSPGTEKKIMWVRTADNINHTTQEITLK